MTQERGIALSKGFYVNGKMRPVESIPGMKGRKIK
jgi:hypothetical protein